MRASAGVMPKASVIRQAGDSVRRVDSRTSLTWSLKVSFSQVSRSANSFSCSSRSAVALVLVGIEVHLALGHRLQRFAVELGHVPTHTSSTGSVSSSTS